MAIGVACVPPVWDAQQVRSVADPYELVVSLRLKIENMFVIDDDLTIFYERNIDGINATLEHLRIEYRYI